MKYPYTHLLVHCSESKKFPLDQMREAVEYLKTIEQTGFVGLQAPVSVKAGQYKLYANPMIKLDEITGKTPKQVWEWFDTNVDEWIRGLITRGGNEPRAVL